MKIIQAELESGPGFDTVRDMNASYKPMSSTELADKPARLTARQASFYRNLIAIAEATQSDDIPIVFELAGRGVVFLDRGCVKMAEHAGFVRPLADGPSGSLETIRLNFDVSGMATAA
jgi:hypothetical protein